MSAATASAGEQKRPSEEEKKALAPLTQAQIKALTDAGWQQDSNDKYWKKNHLFVWDLRVAQALGNVNGNSTKKRNQLPEVKGWEVEESAGTFRYSHGQTGDVVVTQQQAEALNTLYETYPALLASVIALEETYRQKQPAEEEEEELSSVVESTPTGIDLTQPPTSTSATPEELAAFFRSQRMRRWGWGIFLGGLLLGAVMATVVVLSPPAYFPVLAALLGLAGPPALIVLPVIVGVVGMLMGVEVLALLERRRGEKQDDYAKFMQYLILGTAALFGAGMGLLLAASAPVVLDLGFGFAASVGTPGALAIISVLTALLSVAIALVLLSEFDRLTLSMPWSAKADASKKGVPEVPGSGLKPTNSAGLQPSTPDRTVVSPATGANHPPSSSTPAPTKTGGGEGGN